LGLSGTKEPAKAGLGLLCIAVILRRMTLHGEAALHVEAKRRMKRRDTESAVKSASLER